MHGGVAGGGMAQSAHMTHDREPREKVGFNDDIRMSDIPAHRSAAAGTILVAEPWLPAAIAAGLLGPLCCQKSSHHHGRNFSVVELRLGPSDGSCTLSCIRESKHRSIMHVRPRLTITNSEPMLPAI
eukprot:COSAG01_NODE_383_length_17798_cov_351.422058_15_plen_127_part_00